MKVETKYNIGDKILVGWHGGRRTVIIADIVIYVSDAGCKVKYGVMINRQWEQVSEEYILKLIKNDDRKN